MKVFSTKKFIKWQFDIKNEDGLISSIKSNCKRGWIPWWIHCDGMTKEQMFDEGYISVDDWFIEEED